MFRLIPVYSGCTKLSCSEMCMIHLTILRSVHWRNWAFIKPHSFMYSTSCYKASRMIILVDIGKVLEFCALFANYKLTTDVNDAQICFEHKYNSNTAGWLHGHLVTLSVTSNTTWWIKSNKHSVVLSLTPSVTPGHVLYSLLRPRALLVPF